MKRLGMMGLFGEGDEGVDERKRSQWACATTGAFGLACNLLWCTLMGHTPGFLLSSVGIGAWANARLFWLLGILAMGIVLVAFSRHVAEHCRSFSLVLPLLSAVGTACFALSFSQTFFDPLPFAVFGLVIAGFGYFWFSTRYVALLTRSQGFACTVWCIVAAFPLRQLMSAALDGLIDPSQQVLVAIALPFLAAGLFEVSRRIAHLDERAGVLPVERDASGVAAHDSHRASDRSRDVFVALAASALLLAVARIFGLSGTWGDSRFFYFDELGRFPGIAILTVCLVAFAYFALIRMQKRPITLRFQPAILFIVAGLFVVVFRTQISGSPSPWLEAIVEINDPLAHLLFWATVSSAIIALDASPLKIAGLAGTVYAAVSVVCVLFLRGDAMIDSAVILLVAYIIVALAINRSSFSRKAVFAEAEAEAGGDGALGRDGVAQAEASSDGDKAKEVDSAARLNAMIAERCGEISRKYGLSPRETEVFLLLAQGRTGSFIQQELVLAESTVKTHMSHIYTKLEVSGRQEMMALVFGDSSNEEDA